jgi:hypothetical protein
MYGIWNPVLFLKQKAPPLSLATSHSRHSDGRARLGGPRADGRNTNNRAFQGIVSRKLHTSIFIPIVFTSSCSLLFSSRRSPPLLPIFARTRQLLSSGICNPWVTVAGDGSSSHEEHADANIEPSFVIICASTATTLPPSATTIICNSPTTHRVNFFASVSPPFAFCLRWREFSLFNPDNYHNTQQVTCAAIFLC